ncbi:MAG: NAD-dependent protein deacylase [Anaerolineales bacterium]|nr:NAD-dependent protein deacylase [Anaerolineales bacterium]
MADSQFDRLAEYISNAQHMVVFTGAGISSESGIPTYRCDDGIWNRYDPEKFANIDYFYQNPSYYWNFFQQERYPVISQARPNQAHLALASLERKGKLDAVITQNIDGLHQAAGSKRVLELHGNTRRIRCLDCNKQFTMDEVYAQLERRLPPRCESCSGQLKPDVVFYGESLPTGVLDEAIKAAKHCDLFLVIGSSLVVQPAASLPVMAKNNGAGLIIVNRDPTPLDSMADFVIRERASVVLSGFID